MKIIVILLAVMLISGCSSEPKETAYKQVSMEEATRLMEQEKDYVILDVRTRSEFEEGHIPGAVCIPNEEISESAVEALDDKKQLILVYCRSGNRSKQASQKLADMGYVNVVEFGGIKDWPGDVVTGP